MATIKKLIALEGNRQHLDGGAMFGHVPKKMWKNWITPDDQNRIPLSSRCLLVVTDEGKNILFETGIGAFFETKLKDRYGIEGDENTLITSLDKLGILESDIDAVILSHLHFDHAGGLLPEYGDSPPRLNFPNAHYYISKSHWENAIKPHRYDKASYIPILQELLGQSNRLIMIEESTHPDFKFGLNFRFSDGHSKGMLVCEITLSSGRLIIPSDLVPGLPWVHLPITTGYDRFPEKVVDEKQSLYESVLEKNAFLFFNHDPDCACARLKKDETGKYLGEPVSIETFIL